MSDLKEYLVRVQDYDRDTARDAVEPDELTYYYEAAEAIRKYEADHYDEAEAMTSGAEYRAGQWLEAKMAYAQALNYLGRGAELEAELDELEGELEYFNDAVADYFESYYPEFEVYDIKPRFSRECEHGWAVHNYEDANGVMFWEPNDKTGVCPELLEGELIAIAFKLSCGAWIDICVKEPK